MNCGSSQVPQDVLDEINSKQAAEQARREAAAAEEERQKDGELQQALFFCLSRC